MSGDRTVSMIMALGMILLVGSALATRRLPLRTMLLLAGVWAAIFAAAYAVATLFGLAHFT